MNNSSPERSTFDNSYFWNLTLFNSMSKTHKRIACAFCVYFLAYKRKHFKEIFCNQETIASKAKCSVREVGRFIFKYKKFIFKKIWQPKKRNIDGKDKFTSNRYEMDERFFTLLFYLKKKGYVKYWHLHSCRLMTEVHENEELAMSKIGYDFEVINKEMSDGVSEKCPTKDLRISTKSFERIVPPNSVPYIKKLSQNIQESLGIRDEAFKDFEHYLSPSLAIKIIDDIHFSLSRGVVIRSPIGWLSSRLVAQQKHLVGILGKKFSEPRRRAS